MPKGILDDMNEQFPSADVNHLHLHHLLVSSLNCYLKKLQLEALCTPTPRPQFLFSNAQRKFQKLLCSSSDANANKLTYLP